MKIFIVILFMAIVGAGGYFGYQYVSTRSFNTGSAVFKSDAVIKTGTLQKAPVKSSDFAHVLFSEGKTIGVTSQKVDLDDYLGKKVTVTGQPSGTTLYADTVELAK